MWQVRDGPSCRSDANKEVIGVYQPACAADVAMDMLMMREKGTTKEVSHQYGASDEVKALVRKLKARSPPTVHQPSVVSNSFMDDVDDKDDTDKVSYKNSSEDDSISTPPHLSRSKRRVSSPLRPPHRVSRPTRSKKPQLSPSFRQDEAEGSDSISDEIVDDGKDEQDSVSTIHPRLSRSTYSVPH